LDQKQGTKKRKWLIKPSIRACDEMKAEGSSVVPTKIYIIFEQKVLLFISCKIEMIFF
jgi:hypothetical protein